MRVNVTMNKAIDIAAELDDGDFTLAVDEARKLGLQSVQIVTVDKDGETDIYLARPQGVMIAWKPDKFMAERIAIPGGTTVDDIHLTVVYLGHTEDFDAEQQRTILGVTSQVAQKHTQISGKINGIGRFFDANEDGENAVWLGGEFPGLSALRDELVSELRSAGIEWEDKFDSFQPHVTIGWIPEDAETPGVTIAPFNVKVGCLTVCFGGLDYEIDLDGGDWDEMAVPDSYDSKPNVYYPVLSKAAGAVLDDEKKYSYGAWYVPNSVDAHGEWATPDDVQKSLWEYVDRGNRDIFLQHEPTLKAARWVELATIPFPLSVPVPGEDGLMRKHTYPAGTPFMGAIWEDWAWPLVKEGHIRGFSVGGTAQRMQVDMPEEEVRKANSAHDGAGRFARKDGGAGKAPAPKVSGGAGGGTAAATDAGKQWNEQDTYAASDRLFNRDDAELESPEFLDRIATKTGLDRKLIEHVSTRTLNSRKAEMKSVDDRVASQMEQIKSSTGEKLMRGQTVVVNVGGTERIVKLDSVRDGKVYGNTADYDNDKQYVDGWPADKVVRSSPEGGDFETNARFTGNGGSQRDKGAYEGSKRVDFAGGAGDGGGSADAWTQRQAVHRKAAQHGVDISASGEEAIVQQAASAGFGTDELAEAYGRLNDMATGQGRTLDERHVTQIVNDIRSGSDTDPDFNPDEDYED